MSNIKTIQVQPASSTMNSPKYADVHLIAHEEYEQFTMAEFKKTPDFTISNVQGYPNKLVLLPELLFPGSRNNLWQRAKRLYNEKLYTVFSDGFDKLLTLVVLLGIVISAYYLYVEYVQNDNKIVKTYTYKNDDDLIVLKTLSADIIKSEQQYQSDLKNPGVDSDHIKQLANKIESDKINLTIKTLMYYNSDKQKVLNTINTDNTLDKLSWVKLGCTVISSTLLTWHMFKRTTVHRSPNMAVNKLKLMGDTFKIGRINPSG